MNSCKEKIRTDLIITDAVIYIVDKNFSKAESFAVLNGQIAGTGTTKEILTRYTSEKVINARGKFIYPGFNDAHCHFNGYAQNIMQYADLRGTSGPDEVYNIITEHYKKYRGEWVLGRNWDQNDWEVDEFPGKDMLDEIFPDIPVYLIRVDGHAGWCNSKALDLAGITGKTKVTGGMVEVKNGEPTGILIDTAMELVTRHVPEISHAQKRSGLLEAQRDCFAVGLTSVTDCGLDKETILLIEEMQQQGDLKIRVNAMIKPTGKNIEYFLKNGPYSSDRLTVNTIKMYADGALGSRGALLLEDYSDDPGNQGLQIETREYYEEICQMAFNHDFAVATHCIGDSANRLILDIYGKYLEGQNDRRWRIEHAQIIHPDDLVKFARYSIVPSVQATHATSDMYWAAERLGDRLLQGAYAYRTLLDQNDWLPNGTDFPVEHIDPLFTFYASVFRTDHSGWPDGGWLKDEALTREQALRSITVWPAKASFGENKTGSLEPGKWADFVIMDTDLMNADPGEILNAKFESTWITGERVF